jgi:bacterioferritin-associated ferredoxin
MSWDFRKPGTRVCVCYNVSNDQALALWRTTPSVEALTQQHHCGQNCAMCIPYFRTLLDEFQRGEWPPCNKSETNWFGAKHG